MSQSNDLITVSFVNDKNKSMLVIGKKNPAIVKKHYGTDM